MLDETKELLEILEQSEGESELGLRSIENFNQKTESNSKFKMKSNAKFGVVLATELRLPFHPITLDTKNFTKNKPFMLSGELEATLASDLIKAIKAKCQVSKEHQDFYNKLFKEEWDTSETETITKKDIDLWSKYKRLYHISDKVQKAHFSSSSNDFGETFLSEVEYDELGEVKPDSKNVAYEVFEMERDFAFLRLKEVNDRIDHGDLKDKSEKDQKAAKKACFDKMAIKEPRDKGFIRFIAFELDNDGKDGVADDNPILNVSENYEMLKFDFHWSGYDDIKKKLEDFVGSPADRFGAGGDRHSIDYSFVGLKFEDVSEVEEKQRPLELFTGHSWDFKMSGVLNDYVPKFEEKVLNFFSDPQYNGEKYMKRSIYAFNKVSDSDILEKYKVDFGYNKDLINEEMATRYSGLIESIDSSFSEQLMEQVISGERQAMISMDEIAESEAEITKEFEEEQSGEVDLEDIEIDLD